MPSYCGYYYYIVEPRVKAQGFGPPKDRLIPGLVATFFVSAGLFIFGFRTDVFAIAWTAQPQIHYFPSIIGVFLTMIGCYTIVQSLFMYLSFTYPRYTESLFAANDFARSSFAAWCVVFSGPMFRNQGVGKGVSLLGGLTVGCTAGIYTPYWWGAKLRARSRFAVK
ncbi:Caffeine resistance 5 [Hyphodiscus hymeniophilus]|uniref:Caffeine resistance 5 n=1 Tax=Hyphodiscus hymeniophilus TaxID=353542 RepID=A0A9P6VHE4_9HELO|nr:Caffeine resistance 5 [Hyphodiscus hymeniophilus]